MFISVIVVTMLAPVSETFLIVMTVTDMKNT